MHDSSAMIVRAPKTIHVNYCTWPSFLYNVLYSYFGQISPSFFEAINNYQSVKNVKIDVLILPNYQMFDHFYSLIFMHHMIHLIY